MESWGTSGSSEAGSPHQAPTPQRERVSGTWAQGARKSTKVPVSDARQLLPYQSQIPNLQTPNPGAHDIYAKETI